MKKGESGAVVVDPQKAKEMKILRQREEQNKDLLTDEILAALSFGQKIAFISQLRSELISFPAFSYKKLRDLLKLCSESNPDVVLKATSALCDVFEDVLPSYRIRQNYEDGKDVDSKKDGKNQKVKISKEVEQLRS